MELQVLQDGSTVESRVVGDTAVRVGRAPINEIVLRDPGVSAHHAVFWVEAGALRVRDLGSTNGTFVNDQRIAGATAVAHGDRVRLGASATLRVHGTVGDAVALGPLRLEGVEGGVSFGVTSDRFAVPGAGDALLLLDASGEVWLAADGDEVARLEVDVPFELRGRTWVLRRDTDPTPETLRPTQTPRALELTVSLGSQRAELVDRRAGKRLEVTSENRVALLYALGERWLADGGGDGGWIDDPDAAVAVWGRDHLKHGANNYNVLVHRVRADLEGAGFDRWCLEKRSGRSRLRIASVRLER